MIGLDTNIVLRILTEDDPDQLSRARGLLESNDVWLSTTVLLETEWVLRSGYGLSRGKIHEILKKLLGLPQLHPEDPSAAVDALRWYTEGLDFADALHLATTRHVSRFVTFDRQFAHRSEQIEDSPSVELL